MLKKNPLKNLSVMCRLNPYAKAQKKASKAIEVQRKTRRQALLDQKRGVSDGPGRGTALLLIGVTPRSLRFPADEWHRIPTEFQI